MSGGVIPTRTGSGGPLPIGSSSAGISAGGDDIDWNSSPIGAPPAGQWKQPVIGASLGDLTIATLNPGISVDGGPVAVAGDRVLVKDQAAGAENGIYVVDDVPYRAADMDEDSEVPGAAVYVMSGSQSGTVWIVSETGPFVIDTDEMLWVEFVGGGGMSGGAANLDGGRASDTYGGTTALNAGGA